MPGTLTNTADRVLSKNAIQFGESPRYNNIKAWPFWIPFIPYPYLDTDTQNSGLGLFGLNIAAGAILDIPIITDQEVPFYLINIKYTAFKVDIQGTIGAWYEVPAGFAYQPSAIRNYRPIYQYLRPTLIIESRKSTYIYGGNQHDPLTGLQERRVNVRSLQGLNDGKGSLKIPFLVPKESTIKIRLENTHTTSSLLVNGVLFGYKVAV